MNRPECHFFFFFFFFFFFLLFFFFFFLNHSLAGRACTARPPASLKGGRIRPSPQQRGTVAPRAGITLPALVRGARPSAQALLVGQSHNFHAQVPQLTPKHRCEGAAPQPKWPGSSWVCTQGFHAARPQTAQEAGPPGGAISHQARMPQLTPQRPCEGMAPGRFLGLCPGFPCS